MPKQNQTNNYHIVPEEWDGKRLDRFLSDTGAEHSRGHFQKLIEGAFVLINQESALKPSHLVRAGDRVEITGELPGHASPVGEDTPLTILYEDKDILVINKPADLTVHPTANRATGTLVNSLLYHSMAIAEAVYDVHSLISTMRPGIVHRLDKDTSGVMVVAKNQEALFNLAKQFQKHSVEKLYTALLFGPVPEATTISMNIRRKPSRKNMMGVSTKSDEGKEAITHVTPIELYRWREGEAELTLVTCQIETGRTHQIRVHCKYLGHPVIGDPIYTNKPAKKLSEELGVARQMLHAHSLTFTHPRTGQKQTFTAPLPEDFERLLTKLQRT